MSFKSHTKASEKLLTALFIVNRWTIKNAIHPKQILTTIVI